MRFCVYFEHISFSICWNEKCFEHVLQKNEPHLCPIHVSPESYIFEVIEQELLFCACISGLAYSYIYPKIADILDRKKSCLNVGQTLCGGVRGMDRGTVSSAYTMNDGCHSGLFSFGLCLSPGIPKNTTFRKLSLFPSSGERVGVTSVTGFL
jgi:hypothetical protein